MPLDKYNVKRLTHTSSAWMSLDASAIAALKAGGITIAYVSNIRHGRARPERTNLGRALDALRATQPAQAEAIAAAYLLDACPAEHQPAMAQALKRHPLIASAAAPISLTQALKETSDPVQIMAFANLRKIALVEPAARDAIILISKHL